MPTGVYQRTEEHRRARATHGARLYGKFNRLYRIWGRMRERCNNPHHKSYKYYGGKGVTICPEWNDFNTFRVFALSHGYQDNLTIDRLDGNKNYEPDNVQFIPNKENCCKRVFNPHTTPVSQYDLEGNLIKTFVSIAEAIRQTKIGHISQVCLGKRQMAGGYKWIHN